jgi:hypothetical protein
MTGSSRKHLGTPDDVLQAHLDLWHECGFSPLRAAEKVGVTKNTITRHVREAKAKGMWPTGMPTYNGPNTPTEHYAAQSGDAPDYDLAHPLPDGLVLKGVSNRYDASGNVDQSWVKSRMAGMDPTEAAQMPDPKRIVKMSKLYDAQGRVSQTWISEKPEEAAREQLWIEWAKALAQDMPRAEPIPGPETASDVLAACYPVGDHHFGMMSWDKETGANYDLEIAEKLLCRATDYLLAATPACDQAFIVFLGDLVHFDSFEAVTPSSRNLLDADGRFPKIVRVAIRSMRYMIEASLRRHKSIHVIVEIGNHDLSSSIFLMECLNNIYENEPRVTIDTSPSHYHYFTFGKCLIGTHHGHGSKMDKLPLIMATDRPDEWGGAKYRAWWTGHIHTRVAQDYAGCNVESFRILAPVDAWAAQKGYRSARDMKAIILHKEFGEVGRHTCNPDMCVTEL